MILGRTRRHLPHLIISSHMLTCEIGAHIPALQQYPQEVWEHIIHCLDDESAASAARVCYAWTFASRRRPYRYQTFTYPSYKLKETLSVSPAIRACIRRLRLKWHADANFDWVTLLPPENIQSIEFYFYPGCFEETFPVQCNGQLLCAGRGSPYRHSARAVKVIA